jgi:hypothetical protein
MRTVSASFAASIFLMIACGMFVTAAQAAPIANLPLTCPNAGAIGQSDCSGLVYRSPTPELIVLKGPSSAPTWARASTLASADTLAVCTLPVEPGTYSSCRDSSGVRRIAYVPKSTVFPDSPPPSGGTGGSSPRSIAVVAASGGHYTDPLAAAANADQGDAWCRSASDDPARHPCVISIAPGVYELASTLVVPARVAVIGYGPQMTVLTARPGVAATVQLGTATLDLSFDVALRDLTVENRFGAGGTSMALDVIDRSNVEVHHVRATASGASDNIGVRYAGYTLAPFEGRLSRPFPLRLLEAAATGGATSTGFKVVDEGRPRIEQCSISASEASGRNVGLDSDGSATLSYCELAAFGGTTAIALSVAGPRGPGSVRAGVLFQIASLWSEAPPRRARAILLAPLRARGGTVSRCSLAVQVPTRASGCRSGYRSAKAISRT